MTKEIELLHYQKVLQEAEQTILAAQQQFIQNANRTSIELYWSLGKFLANIAENYQWGQQVLARLAQDLCKTFANATGDSEQN